jgi:ribosomal protein L13
MTKRTIRGMLPWKKSRGKEAFRLIKCFNTLPEEYSGKDKITFKKASAPNVQLKRLVELI